MELEESEQVCLSRWRRAATSAARSAGRTGTGIGNGPEDIPDGEDPPADPQAAAGQLLPQPAIPWSG
jgi:hypothetical protein